MFQAVKMAMDGGYDYKGFMKKVKTQGGLMAYFGVNDLRVIEERINQGDERGSVGL